MYLSSRKVDLKKYVRIKIMLKIVMGDVNDCILGNIVWLIFKFYFNF